MYALKSNSRVSLSLILIVLKVRKIEKRDIYNKGLKHLTS